RINQWQYGEESTRDSVNLEKGQEMGRFNMGSTVVLLFEKNQIEWVSGLKADSQVEMGQEIATLLD
ncbi:MAG: phosphatidylserine decarboxylase, partial [Sedimenticola sp.]|nr:phosphatidylserine decarboxylase [Sedimenticola sp.]